MSLLLSHYSTMISVRVQDGSLGSIVLTSMTLDNTTVNGGRDLRMEILRRVPYVEDQ